MEKQPENEANNNIESSDQAGEVLSEKELDQVSGGDDAPKETITFNYGSMKVE